VHTGYSAERIPVRSALPPADVSGLLRLLRPRLAVFSLTRPAPQSPAGPSGTMTVLDNVDAIAVIAGLACIVSAVGLRLVDRGNRGPSAASPVPAPGSNPRRVPGPPRSAPRDDSPAETPVSIMQLGTHATAVEFVNWMRAMGVAGCRRSAAEIIDFYGWFCADMRVAPLGEGEFLAALSNHRQVRKKRDRIKCPKTGKVLKLASGTPARTRYYTILDADEVRLPTGVSPAATRAESRPQTRAEPRAQTRTPAQARARVDSRPSADDFTIGRERIAA